MRAANRLCWLVLGIAWIAGAHPMGNFSVSHYAKFEVGDHTIQLEYALDLAEIPTFQLLRDANLDRDASHADVEKAVKQQTSTWLRNLELRVDGKHVQPDLRATGVVMSDGAGGLPILRITMSAQIQGRGRRLTYEDHNYSDRAGWKEIVIEGQPGVVLTHASQSSADVSRGLTHYPTNPATAPPQDLRAVVSWNVPVTPFSKDIAAEHTKVEAINQPHQAAAASAPALRTRVGAPAGAVIRGDFLSRFLRRRQLTPWMILLAVGVSFLLGGAHALTPGHGKTIVAAYLVGSRGTLKHAAFLGLMVTFTHTFVVFLLGIASLFLFRYVVPEKVTQILGLISGLSIVLLGGCMLRNRVVSFLTGHSHVHHHHHHHADGEHPNHSHPHTHVPESLSWGALIALGASGGLAPCESALVLLLGAIALGRVGLGLLLLTSFSVGLAAVLVGIGALVLYAKNLIPEKTRAANRASLQWLSIASAGAVFLAGILMTGIAMGLIRPEWAIG
jgi:nickel/cobalt transporter (NicO) family protein